MLLPIERLSIANRRKAAAVVAALGLAVSAHLGGPARADDAMTAAGMITMEGRGSVSIAPDMAVITTRVATAAKTAPAALDENTRLIGQVIGEIKAAGIEARDIQTSGFSIYPTYERLNNGANREPRIIGYEVRNGVEVNVRDLTKLGPLLDSVVRSGANTVDGIRFQVSDPQDKLDEARTAAVADARRKAELFARAAGVGLGAIVSISETGAAQPRPVAMFRAAVAEAAPVPIEAGEETLSASVTITWSLKQPE